MFVNVHVCLFVFNNLIFLVFLIYFLFLFFLYLVLYMYVVVFISYFFYVFSKQQRSVMRILSLLT